jgi:hypothetical protein
MRAHCCGAQQAAQPPRLQQQGKYLAADPHTRGTSKHCYFDLRPTWQVLRMLRAAPASKESLHNDQLRTSTGVGGKAHLRWRLAGARAAPPAASSPLPRPPSRQLPPAAPGCPWQQACAASGTVQQQLQQRWRQRQQQQQQQQQLQQQAHTQLLTTSSSSGNQQQQRRMQDTHTKPAAAPHLLLGTVVLPGSFQPLLGCLLARLRALDARPPVAVEVGDLVRQRLQRSSSPTPASSPDPRLAHEPRRLAECTACGP